MNAEVSGKPDGARREKSPRGLKVPTGRPMGTLTAPIPSTGVVRGGAR